MSRSTPLRHHQPPQGPSERDNDHQDCTTRTARGRDSRRAAVELHLAEGAGKADRDQPQRHHSPGGAGAAAARCRAADPAEPAGLPAEKAVKRLLLLALFAAAPAAAQTPAVEAARAAGAVGERYDGYMGVASAVSATVRSQLAGVNIRRRSLYSRLAASKGVSPQDVGITAGCQLLARVTVGEAYMPGDGRWRRRAPGGP